MHFEQMGVSLSVPGKEEKPRKTKGKELLAPARITKKNMMTWIKKAGLDEETKAELLALVAKYPANTMHHFFSNIHEHIKRIHASREKKTEE